MLQEIRDLQVQLGMSNGELLALARLICGYAGLRCVENLLGCEMLELRDDLQGMLAIQQLAQLETASV